MYLPMTASANSNNTKKIKLLSFFGINQRDKIDDRQFSETMNMSSDAYPALSVRRPRKKVCSTNYEITSVCLPEYSSDEISDFTGVANNRFFYKGKVVDNILLSDGKKSIVDFNGNICIFPDKVFYSYLPNPENGEYTSTLKSMEKSLSIDNAKLYSSLDKISGEYNAYIQKSGAGFDEVFSVGDSVIISGCSNEKNNTFVVNGKHEYAEDDRTVSVVVNGVSSSKLELLMFNKNGKYNLFENSATDANTITVKISIPDMNNVCVHNNRLWGTADNGEYIYASKLGDCFNFNSFQGLGDDSWYSEIGTDGSFTGITSYRSAVVAFKQNYIHHVYGDSPNNFSIPKQTFGGAKDGESIVELNGILYFMGANGFFEYSGGEPEKISSCISEKYTACTAGTDGEKYYACVKKTTGDFELLTYHPGYGIWYREDSVDFAGFFKHNEYLYGAVGKDVLKLNAEDIENESDVKWSAVSKQFTLDDFDFKGANSIYIRSFSYQNSWYKVLVSLDGGEFIEYGSVISDKFFAHKIPVRFGKCDSFRIKLCGTGHVVIHDVEINIYKGGRTNGEYTR